MRIGTATAPSAPGTIPSPPTLQPRPAIGRNSSVARPKFPSTESTSFSGASGKRTALALPETYSSTCSAARISLPAVPGRRAPWRPAACASLKDGRDANDVMLGLFDYPEGFNLSLRVNFVDGGEESEGLVFTGSEGTLEIAFNTLTISRTPREKQPGFFINSFTEAMQKRILDDYHKKYPAIHSSDPPSVAYEKYVAPEGYRDSYDHFKNFFAAVRSRQPVVEDAVFGYRAAGAALLSNLSVERGSVVKWDPNTMKLLS